MVSDAAFNIHALFLADMVSSPIDESINHSNDSSLSSEDSSMVELQLSTAPYMVRALHETYPMINRLESHVLELAKNTLRVLSDKAIWICHVEEPPTLPELMNRFCAAEDSYQELVDTLLKSSVHHACAKLCDLHVTIFLSMEEILPLTDNRADETSYLANIKQCCTHFRTLMGALDSFLSAADQWKIMSDEQKDCLMLDQGDISKHIHRCLALAFFKDEPGMAEANHIQKYLCWVVNVSLFRISPSNFQTLRQLQQEINGTTRSACKQASK